MALLRLIPYYISWHYTQGTRDLIRIWKTMMWFVPSFFSIGTLMRTLIAPFERLNEQYRGGLDVENFFSTLIINTVMRLVGLFVRAAIILFGAFSWCALVCIGAVSFIGWLLLPALIVFLVVIGVIAFFNTP